MQTTGFEKKNLYICESQPAMAMEGPCTPKQIYRNLKRRDTYPF